MGGAKVGHVALSGGREGGGIFTVDLYRKVRRAYFLRQGMRKLAIARHVRISRDSVHKMIVYAVPPGYRRMAPARRLADSPFDTASTARWLLSAFEATRIFGSDAPFARRGRQD